MLKSQDLVVLLKLLANPEHLDWPQHQLATYLCLSVSAINSSLSRLRAAGLINLGLGSKRYQLVMGACEELLVHGARYVFPATLGEYTRGMATSYASPVFKNKIVIGDEPIPVWPCAEGSSRGLALTPLYHNVPNSLLKFPDQEFYDLLALVDAIRHGRARERNLAIKMLKERMQNYGETK